MGSRENAVEKYLNDCFKKRGGFTRKWVAPAHVGVPDRICFLYGLVYFVEVKCTDGKLSSMQQREMNRLLQMGMNVAIVYGCKDVDALMVEIDEAIRTKKTDTL